METTLCGSVYNYVLVGTMSLYPVSVELYISVSVFKNRFEFLYNSPYSPKEIYLQK